MSNITSPITEADINAIEKVMGSDFHFDENRRQIIKAITKDSVKDVQAFPGTGKTTLLIAKLGILAKKWCNNHGGICVLSFTNAASDEVQQRLGRTTYGASLMSYPHYIGTIHSFLATYVVEPWFQSKGTHVQTIDSDIVVSRRWNGLTKTSQNVLLALGLSRYYLQKSSFDSLNKVIHNKWAWSHSKSNRATACEVLGITPYELDDRDATGLVIQQHLINIVEEIITGSISKGELTFEEIIYFARKAVHERPEIANIVSNRFPILFVDEAQDTTPAQYECLGLLFIGSIMQTFGDKNQSIFNAFKKAEMVELPREDCFQLSDSKRLSPSLVKLVTPLAKSDSTMIGCNKRFPQAQNTVILFEKDQANQVLPCFARLILQTFSDEDIRKNHDCHAVGLIHRVKSSELDKAFPRAVNSYYPNYNPDLGKVEKSKYEHLIEYQRSARHILKKSDNSTKALQVLLAGVQRLFKGVDTQLFRSGQGSPLTKIGKQMSQQENLAFRQNLQALMQADYDSNLAWQLRALTLKATISKIEGYESIDGYLDWTVPQLKLSQQSNEAKGNLNCFTFEEGGRSISIHLGSIHSVKGQTHLATLVLETNYYNHVLQTLLPCLEGKQSMSTLGTRGRYTYIPTTYVGLTRAEGLACLAIPKDELLETDQVELKKMGWNIITIPKSASD